MLLLSVGLVAGALQLRAVPASAHSFGSTPLDDVVEEAGNATRCTGLTRNELAAMMLAPTWPETGAGNSAPSPMTLSRSDTDIDLYSFGTVDNQQRAFWHPGVGMWQLDDAGLGAFMPANQRINTLTAARKVAETMASRYCKSSGSPQNRREAAWAQWFACGSGVCEDLYREHYCAFDDSVCNIDRTPGVGRLGGMQTRICRYHAGPATFTCWYVNPANAQGDTGFWQSDPKMGDRPNGLSPLAFAFYVYLRTDTKPDKEWRHWLQEDTGYDVGEVFARRVDGMDSRRGLEWVDDNRLCDVEERRGTCT
jgi:hypothetical protein